MAGRPGRRRVAAAVAWLSAPLGCCVGPSNSDAGADADSNASSETSTTTAFFAADLDSPGLNDSKSSSREFFSDPSSLKETLVDDPTIQSNYPGFDTGNITTVYVGIRVAHLFGIDTKDKTYIISGSLHVQWHDERLDFSDVNFSGFDHLEWDDGDIWTPQVYLRDVVTDDSKEDFKFLRSLSDGTVRLDRVVHLRVMCSAMSFDLYPWDKQACSMTFVPLKASAAEVKLEFFSLSGMTGIEELSLGEWQEFSTSWVSGTHEVWHFNELVEWPYARGTFEMRRISRGRLYNIVLPSVLMTGMSYSGFWIDPASAPARVALSMIAVLATLTHRSSVMAVLPVVSSLVWVDVYLAINLAFNIMAVICYALVNYGMQCEAAEKNAEDAARKKDDSDDPAPRPPPSAPRPPPSAPRPLPEGGGANGHVAHDPGHDATEDWEWTRTATGEWARTARRPPGVQGPRRKVGRRTCLSKLVHIDKIMRVLYPVCYLILNAYMAGLVWEQVLLL